MDPNGATEALYDPENDAVEASPNGSEVTLSLNIEEDKDSLDIMHGRTLGVLESSTAETSTSSRHRNTETLGSNATSPHANKLSISAVYRWYDIEEGLHLKKREESSIARCKLCRQEGKLERKSCVRFSKSVTSNLWRHLKENHPMVYTKHAGEKKSIQMHRLVGAKKRGRKKKINGEDQENEDNSKKKQRKADQFFSDYPSNFKQTIVGTSTLSTSAHIVATINMDKFHEAIGHLCVHEMIPFEVVSGSAFRNVLAQVTHETIAFEDIMDSTSVMVAAKKIVDEQKQNVTNQMKSADTTHVILSEWTCSSSVENSSSSFLAVLAVGLDPDFQPFQRCLDVFPLPLKLPFSTENDTFKRAMNQVIESTHSLQFLPHIITHEPRDGYHQFFENGTSPSKHLDSITGCLDRILLYAIQGISIKEWFGFDGPFLFDKKNEKTNAIEFLTKQFDDGEMVFESTVSSCTNTESQEDEFFSAPEPEAENEKVTATLKELPSVLSNGKFAVRDVLYKILYFFAHVKKSFATRQVLKKIFVEHEQQQALQMGDLSGQLSFNAFQIALGNTILSLSSISKVISLFLQVKPAIERYFLLQQTLSGEFVKTVRVASLSNAEWGLLESLKKIFKPFADATSKLRSEKYCSSSLIIPSVFTLLEKLRTGTRSEMQENTFKASKELKSLAFRNLSSAFGYFFESPSSDWDENKNQTFLFFWSATLLDPRTRPFAVKGPLSQNEFWEMVKLQAATLAGGIKQQNQVEADHQEAVNSNGRADVTTHNLENSDTAEIEKTGDLWDDLQANLTSCAQEEMLLSSSKTLEMTKSHNLLEVEVTFFQEESYVSLRANPLEWWRGMKLKYPWLSRLARVVLFIPVETIIENNPVTRDCGLLKRAQGLLKERELADFLCASMNYRIQQIQAEAEESTAVSTGTAGETESTKQVWSTV